MKSSKNLAVIIIVAAIAFMAGTVFAESDQPIPTISSFQIPIQFDGIFTLHADGTGTCNGSFTIDPFIWHEFTRAAEYNGSIWVGIGEIFDGRPFGPDEEDPEYMGMWNFFLYMREHNPWPYVPAFDETNPPS